MTRSRGDMGLSMQGRLDPARVSGGTVGGPRAALTREEFSSRFQAAAPGLWCIAVAVLGERRDAEDVLQDAAAIGLGKLETFDPSTSFAAWMGEIVRNVARNHARKQDRRRTTPADPAAIDAARPAADPAPLPVLHHDGRLRDDQAELDDRVIRALATLDETPRICLLLRTLESMPYRDISQLLGIPEGTAMSHVHRSRRALRESLLASDNPGARRA